MRFLFDEKLILLQKETPGPNAYDVPRAYQALTSHPRQPPRSKPARQRHSQFLSAAKRTFAGDTSIDTPGPAAYDSFPTTRTHGYAPSFDERFRKDTSVLPGPADYEVRVIIYQSISILSSLLSYLHYFKIPFFAVHSMPN